MSRSPSTLSRNVNMNRISQPFRWMAYTAKTLYLFTKADLKVIVLPGACLASASAPLSSLSRLPHILFWLWLHTLALALSNQSLNPSEDLANKPDRPIPSGRISLRTTVLLRWFLLPQLCFLWSLSYSKELFYASVFNAFLVFIYNEMGLADGHWLGRQIVNAFGHVSYELGATLLAGPSAHHLDPIALRSILCSFALVLFTIQAQDFKDTAGDLAVGRSTLPIVHPSLARPSFMSLLIACSIAVCYIWQTPLVLALVVVGFAVRIGWLFVMRNSQKEDKGHLFLYLIWLSVAHVLPAYYRFSTARVI